MIDDSLFDQDERLTTELRDLFIVIKHTGEKKLLADLVSEAFVPFPSVCG